MKTRLASLAVAGMVVLGGCGDDGGGTDGGSSDGGPDATPTAVSLPDICSSSDGVYVQMLSKLYECFPELDYFLGGTPSANDLSALCEGSFLPHINDTTVTYAEPSVLSDCRTYLAELTCETLALDGPNACTELLVGNVAEGSECDVDVQCAGAAYCAAAAGDTCGTCTAQKADGENCTDNSECKSGNCSGFDAATGNPGLCRGYGGEGDPCASYADCTGTLICDKSGAEPVCAIEPQWAAGMPCDELELRACNPYSTGLYCDNGSCAAFAELGESCRNSQCNYTRYEYCPPGPQATCAAAAQVSAGEQCDTNVCMPGLACVDDDGDPQTAFVCVMPAGPGDSCLNAGEECSLLLECSIDGTCEYGSYTGMCPQPQ